MLPWISLCQRYYIRPLLLNRDSGKSRGQMASRVFAKIPHKKLLDIFLMVGFLSETPCVVPPQSASLSALLSSQLLVRWPSGAADSIQLLSSPKFQIFHIPQRWTWSGYSHQQPGLLVPTSVLVTFLSLWKKPWLKQLIEGRVYLSLLFQNNELAKAWQPEEGAENSYQGMQAQSKERTN